jgi:hypothetical protein
MPGFFCLQILHYQILIFQEKNHLFPVWEAKIVFGKDVDNSRKDRYHETGSSHRSSVIGHRSSVIAHRSSLIGHRSSVIGHLSTINRQLSTKPSSNLPMQLLNTNRHNGFHLPDHIRHAFQVLLMFRVHLNSADLIAEAMYAH